MQIPTSPYDKYCIGYQNPEVEGAGYVMTLAIGVGKTKNVLSHAGSQVLDNTNAFDRAEVEETNLGQTNMITVSSFCGPQGKMWGLDLARTENVYDKKLFSVDKIPVYSAQPLLDATKFLFGTVTQPIFPPLPGTHIPCATKNITAQGPNTFYAAIGMGVPADRANVACLMMEDVGFVGELTEIEILERLARSITAVAQNQQVKYKVIFTSLKKIEVNENETGCALVAAPYIALAKQAVQGHDLSMMTLTEWGKMI